MTRRVALLAAALALGWAAAAGAQVTNEQPASMLVFPKLIVGGSRDAVIQVSNSGNSTIGVHCWYVDGALTFPDLPPGGINPPRCAVTDFQLVLTQKQPTSWVASRGRPVDPLDNQCGEIGSILVTRLPACNEPSIAEAVRGDDLFRILLEHRKAGVTRLWAGTLCSFLVGFLWSGLTYALADRVARAIGEPALPPIAGPPRD